jgi:hypothetical protein
MKGAGAEGPSRPARLSVANLRDAVALRMWGGNGCGAPCDFCRVVVSHTDIEYEVEAQLGTEKLMLHFHPRCHDEWSAGRLPPAAPASSAGSAA